MLTFRSKFRICAVSEKRKNCTGNRCRLQYSTPPDTWLLFGEGRKGRKGEERRKLEKGGESKEGMRKIGMGKSDMKGKRQGREKERE